MKNLIITFILFSTSSFFAASQSIERSAISTAGQELSNSSLSLEFTIGEFAVGYFANGGGTTLSQGFNQANISKPGAIVGVFPQSAKLYPNPFSNLVNISILQTSKVQIYDVTARLIKELNLFKGVHEINTSIWKSGVYTIVLTNNNGSYQSFRMIKL